MACNCKQKIITQVQNIIPLMENTQFKLRDSIDFNQIQFSDKKIAGNEITDEIIIEFLKANPNRISLFSEFPENWNEVIAEESSITQNNKQAKRKTK